MENVLNPMDLTIFTTTVQQYSKSAMVHVRKKEIWHGLKKTLPKISGVLVYWKGLYNADIFCSQ